MCSSLWQKYICSDMYCKLSLGYADINSWWLILSNILGVELLRETNCSACVTVPLLDSSLTILQVSLCCLIWKVSFPLFNFQFYLNSIKTQPEWNRSICFQLFFIQKRNCMNSLLSLVLYTRLLIPNWIHFWNLN